MFLEKYVNSTYYNLILNNYNSEYLNSLDEDNFIKIYNLFKKYKFYFIDDIVLKYLEIFDMDEDDVEEKINFLHEKLGDRYIYIIGNDLRYLDEILDYDV